MEVVLVAVTLISGHVSRALDFYNKSSIYFVLGKTSAWQSSDDPSISDYKPIEPKNTDRIQEILGFRKIDSKYLVVPDNAHGELNYAKSKWKIVQPEEAVAKGARWVYITATVDYQEFATNISYRQLAVTTQLVPKAGLDTKLNLSPSEVVNQGIFEALDNRTPIFRSPNQREHLTIIIEF